jgi:medium-chain acyl-[acyl-carrier-protein] hydrolase
MKLVLPALRADVQALEAYEYVEEARLECPISCFGGLNDRSVSRPDLDAWRDETSGPFQVRDYPGGHFYLEANRVALLHALSADLRRQGWSVAEPHHTEP